MLRISESTQTCTGSLGSNAQETYSFNVWSDEADLEERISVDNAEDVGVVTRFALSNFAVISPLGNVFSDFTFEKVPGGIGRWKFSAIYKSPTAERITQDASFSFKIGGGTKHITTSKKTVSSVNARKFTDPATIPNFGGAINVTGSGPNQQIAGVDVPVSSFDFKTTFYVHPKDMTAAYVEELKSSCACVNSDQVAMNVDGLTITFDPGELLLLGADGQKRKGIGDWELGLSWSHLPNQKNLVFNTADGDTDAIDQNGWDYLWVWYGPAGSQSGSNVIAKMPVAVYVEQVFDYVPMSLILLPNTFGLSNSLPWIEPSLYGMGGFQPVLGGF
jgi:hypothetical protein